MKLAMITDEVTQDLEAALRFAGRFHLEGVELRTVWDKSVHQLSDDELARVKDMLADCGLSAPCIASPVFKCELDDELAHREHLEWLRRCIHAAHFLNANIIRLFTFWKQGPSEPVWERIQKQFRPALAIAEGEGITLGLENESSTYCATARETARFLSEIDSPHVKVVWDPCNEVFAEEGITPYPDAYRLVEPWVVHVHVKDARKSAPESEPILTPVGEGGIDWAGQLRELLGRGYQGYVALETHWRPESLPQEMLNRPGGSGFSESGEYASDICMRNLLKLLEEIKREAG